MNSSAKKIVLVNGLMIRNTLDPDFGLLHERGEGIAHFAPKFYIPPGEIWVDHRFQAELDFLLAEDAFTPPPGTSAAACRQMLKDKFCLPPPPPDFIRRSDTPGQTLVRYVDGAIVRRYFDPEFHSGGHDLVYPTYIPTGEIWIDADMDERDFAPVILHEQVERDLMAAGKSYDVAHEYATAAERERRRALGGAYPGDATYPWADLSNEEIIEKYYVITRR